MLFHVYILLFFLDDFMLEEKSIAAFAEDRMVAAIVLFSS